MQYGYNIQCICGLKNVPIGFSAHIATRYRFTRRSPKTMRWPLTGRGARSADRIESLPGLPHRARR